MKISQFLFFLVIISSFEAKRISKAKAPACPLSAPTVTTTVPTTTTPVAPTTTTNTATPAATTTATTATPAATTTTTTATPAATTTTTTSSSTSGVPGLGANGNPVGMDVTDFVQNADLPANVLACSSSRFAASSSGVWTFNQIADAFYEYGVKPWNFANPTNRTQHVADCVAALVIASGECESVAGQVGCSTASGPSGVWQTDFLRTIPGFPAQPIMNLCTSAWGAGYMAAPWIAAAGQSCTVSYNNGTGASIFTCYAAPLTVNQYGATCADPQATAGVTYSNFIGPFCHKAYSSRWSPCTTSGPDCCALFNGGGNSYQGPFPQYYFNMASTQGGANFLSICQAASLLGPVS